MARNEEKQLARLNRFYLQKDKEAQRKKNPPRPRLETLNTTAEIQKWLPSIKRDLDFCIKQSEVTCYPQSKIDQFSRKINGLKWEYRSFVQKLRELNPGLEVTPWTDRPYAGHKRKAATSDLVSEELDFTKYDVKTSCLESSISASADTPSKDCDSFLHGDQTAELTQSVAGDTVTDSSVISVITDQVSSATNTHAIQVFQFIPISAPVLEKESCYSTMYGYNKPAPVILNADKQLEDVPLQFNTDRNSTREGTSDAGRSSQTGVNAGSVTLVEQKMHSTIGKRVETNRVVDGQDKPLQFDSGELATSCTNGQNSLHPVGVIARSGSCQYSDIVDSKVTVNLSSSDTHLPTTNTHTENTQMKRKFPHVSYVVPYSDSESDTDT